MKKLLQFLVYATVILTLSSCDAFNDKKQNQEVKGNATAFEGISQEIKGKIAAQDTLMNALVNQVDTLAQTLSQVQQDNAKLKDQVTQLESPKSTWGYMTLAALAIAIIALVLSLLNIVMNRKDVDMIFRRNLDNSQRVKALKNDVDQLKSGQSKINTALQNYESRLQTVDNTLSRNKLNEFQNISPSSTTNNQNNIVESQKTVSPKVGYAKNDADMYFTTIYNSNQEGCVFKISFTNKTKGNFTIISLDKIQSRNDWQRKVECTGCSIKEASKFRTVDDGICEKIDESTWKVTKPLKIQLLK